MANKSPSFQFYPDIWEMHTTHLSDVSYRIFHRIFNWMWLMSPDRSSIPKDPRKIAKLLGETQGRVRKALSEIMDPELELLDKDGDRFVSRRLRREIEKQEENRKKKRKAADIRWMRVRIRLLKGGAEEVEPNELANARRKLHKLENSKGDDSEDAPALQMHCPPIGGGVGDISEEGESRGGAFRDKHPAYARLVDDPEFTAVTPEAYQLCLARHGKVDAEAAVTRTLEDALLKNGLDEPGSFLLSRFRILEMEGPAQTRAGQESIQDRDRQVYEKHMAEMLERAKVADEWRAHPIPGSKMDVDQMLIDVENEVRSFLGPDAVTDYNERRKRAHDLQAKG